MKTGSGAASCSLVTEAAQTVRAPGCGAAMVNADGHGYYFTEYEPAAVAALARRDPPLTAPERISLLGDEWRIVRAGRHDIGTYLDLAAAFAERSDAGRRRGDRRPAGVRPRRDRRCRPAPALRCVGEDACSVPRSIALASNPRPGDSDDVNSLRGTLLLMLSGDPDVQQRARALALRYLDQPSAVPPTLVASVLQVAAAGGDAALYDRYVAKMNASIATPEEYYRFFNALAAFDDPALRQSHADVRAQRRALAGHAAVAGAVARRRCRHGVDLRQGQLAGADRQGRHVPGHPVYRQLARRRLLRSEQRRDQEVLRRPSGARSGARARSRPSERIAACVAVEQRQSRAVHQVADALEHA